ncbi:MAG: type II toxin-antitoxin system VapC family toxin [Lapillicoccus sp.]
MDSPATIVDSNVLLDVVTEDATWGAWSSEALAKAADRGVLVINPVIYAEVSTRFTRIEDLDDALHPRDFRRDALPWDAAFLAAKAFSAYRNRGGRRETTLPDFFVGAHAAVEGFTLLTRDAKRYRTYFPTVSLMTPS